MSSLHRLRMIALAEGASFVVLLFVAMPLKYLAGMPLAVRIVGTVHGLLFIVFLAVLYRAATDRRWPLHRALAALVSAVVPFGTFVFDRSIARELAD
jgi:integral membrane protein